MAWDYAELAREASERGGPAALRGHYLSRGASAGFSRGAVIGAVVAGTAITTAHAVEWWRARRARTTPAPAAPGEITAPDDSPKPAPTMADLTRSVVYVPLGYGPAVAARAARLALLNDVEDYLTAAARQDEDPNRRKSRITRAQQQAR